MNDILITDFWILITVILMEGLKALISNALSFALFRILSAFFFSTFQNCSFFSSFKLNKKLQKILNS